MWIVSFDNVVVMLTSFVVCRMIPAIQGAFCWRVLSLCAVCAVVRAAAFDTRRVYYSTLVCVHTVDIVRIAGYVSYLFVGVRCA